MKHSGSAMPISAIPLSRECGIANLRVMHRLSDLDAIGDASSRARALVAGVWAVMLRAAMMLLGDRNWYLPRCLARLRRAEPPSAAGARPAGQALPVGQTP
jgi:hypothetical protein